MATIRLSALLFIYSLLAAAAESDTSYAGPLTAQQIVERLWEADVARANQLDSYTATRTYRLVNPRFNKQAEITARITYTKPGDKRFEIVSEQGSRLICERILRRVIGAETDSSKAGNRDLARLNFTNYEVSLLKTEAAFGRTYYVLGLEPRSKSPYLIKGQAWVDANDFALVKLEGTVAKRPSVWVGSPFVKQTYLQMGSFWLPDKNLSTTEAPVFGKTDLAIESTRYEIRPGGAVVPVAGRFGQ